VPSTGARNSGKERSGMDAKFMEVKKFENLYITGATWRLRVAVLRHASTRLTAARPMYVMQPMTSQHELRPFIRPQLQARATLARLIWSQIKSEEMK
jgi:hypothetical protein